LFSILLRFLLYLQIIGFLCFSLQISIIGNHFFFFGGDLVHQLLKHLPHKTLGLKIVLLNDTLFYLIKVLNDLLDVGDPKVFAAGLILRDLIVVLLELSIEIGGAIYIRNWHRFTTAELDV